MTNRIPNIYSRIAFAIAATVGPLIGLLWLATSATAQAKNETQWNFSQPFLNESTRSNRQSAIQNRPDLPIFDNYEACRRKFDEMASLGRQLRESLGDDRRQAAREANDGRDLSLRLCVTSEQAAAEKLAETWPTLPVDTVLSFCRNQRSYSDLMSCIDQRHDISRKQDERATFINRMAPSGEAMPRYDIELMCRRQVQDHHNPTPQFQNCFSRQQAAYDELKPLWPRLSADITQRCRALIGQPGLYTVLLACINSTIERAMKEKELPKLQFRY